MTREWLRHPARTIGRPVPCPSGLDRFASQELALRAALGSVGDSGQAPAVCPCGGWHLVPRSPVEPRRAEAWAPEPCDTGVPAPTVKPSSWGQAETVAVALDGVL